MPRLTRPIASPLVHRHSARQTQKKPATVETVAGFFECEIVMRVSVLCRPGSDLLFQVLRLSTIGAGKFNGRVRNGIGFRLSAVTTRPAKDGLRSKVVLLTMVVSTRSISFAFEGEENGH